MKFAALTLLVSFSLSLSLSTAIQAQTNDWFTLEAIPSEEVLTDAEQNQLSLLLSYEYAGAYKVLQTSNGEVGSYTSEPFFMIELPEFEKPVSFAVNRHETRLLAGAIVEGVGGVPDARRVPLPGPVEPCYGHAFVTENDGYYNGRVNVSTGEYAIHALSREHAAVIAYEAPMSGESCAGCDGGSLTDVSTDSQCEQHQTSLCSSVLILEPSPSTTINSNRCRIDLVVAYSESVANEYGYATSEAMTTVSDMNVALRRSGIDHISYRLVGFVNLETYDIADQTDPTEALVAAQVNQEILDLYDDYGADQVLVYVQAGGISNLNGNSELIEAPDTRNLAVAEVNTAPRYTGVHELGHNFGCKHRNDDQTGGPGQLEFNARGHRIDPDDPDGSDNGTDKVEISVMAVRARDETETEAEVRGTRILNFSNPAISFEDRAAGLNSNGVYDVWPTGTSDRNNAAQILETACMIANFEDEVVEGVWAEGPHQIAPGGTAVVNADRRCRGGFAGQLSWDVSIDGGPWQSTNCGGSTSCPVTIPTSAYSVRVRVSLICSNNEVYTAVHNVFADDCAPSYGLEAPRVPMTEPNVIYVKDVLSVSDKSDRIKLTFTEAFIGEVLVSDLQGRVIVREEIEAEHEDVYSIATKFSGRQGQYLIVAIHGARGTQILRTYVR